MSNSGIKKSHKRLLIFLLIAIITAGGVFMFSMLVKSQEERRNREYEVSLVETLKDSYEGIEKISFSTFFLLLTKSFSFMGPYKFRPCSLIIFIVWSI